MVYIKQVILNQHKVILYASQNIRLPKMTQVVPINPHLIQLMENALDDLLTWNVGANIGSQKVWTDFWNFLVSKFITKVAKLFGDFLSDFEQGHVLSKKCRG